MMKKAAKIFLGVIIAIAILVGGLFFYLWFTDTTTVVGDPYWYGLGKMDAYVCVYEWDGTDAARTVEIPDTLEGKKVTALGGGNSPFYINVATLYPQHAAEQEAVRNGEFELPEDEMDGSMPGDDFDEIDWQGEIVYVDFTLKLGKNIKSIKSIDDDVTFMYIDGESIAVLNRVYVECDPENKTYYSQDGVLYLRKDDSVVDGFRYQELSGR